MSLCRPFDISDATDAAAFLSTATGSSSHGADRWVDAEALWTHAFTDVLRIDPREHRILLTAPPLRPQESVQPMLERMMETYGFESFALSHPGLLALYAQGIFPLAQSSLSRGCVREGKGGLSAGCGIPSFW